MKLEHEGAEEVVMIVGCSGVEERVAWLSWDEASDGSERRSGRSCDELSEARMKIFGVAMVE